MSNIAQRLTEYAEQNEFDAKERGPRYLKKLHRNNALLLREALAERAELVAQLARVLADADAGNGETPATSRWPEAHAALAKANGGKLFAVETATTGDWEDCWTQDDKPLRFPSRAAAEQAIAEHLSSCAEAVRLGHMADGYSRGDFRVVEVTP